MTDADALTVLCAQSGDRDALDRLLRAVQEPLFRYIARLAGDRALAEEVLQEVFILIYRKLRWLGDRRAHQPQHAAHPDCTARVEIAGAPPARRPVTPASSLLHIQLDPANPTGDNVVKRCTDQRHDEAEGAVEDRKHDDGCYTK